MSLSRRIFVRAATAAGIAALLPRGVAFGQQKGSSRSSALAGSQIPREAMQNPLAGMTKSDFEGQVGSLFRFLVSSRGWEELQLIEVRDVGPALTEVTGRECFALIFSGTHGRPHPQAVYKIEHGYLGEFQMLVVPNGAKGRFGPNYAAIINRAH